MRTLRWICALFLLGLASPSLVFSQAVNALLLGTVTDTSGASVPNAKVTATEANTGISRTAETNGYGNYSFPDLAPGQYMVSVELTGFKKENRTGVNLIVNTSTRVDVQLSPGTIQETVEISGPQVILETDRADTGTKFDSVQTESLPLLAANRTFQSLLNLVPGTVRGYFPHSQFFNASSALQTEVNNEPRHGNNFQIEGIDDNERTGLVQIMIPPAEAIQTVDVSTSNYEAELGRATGAVTNVILKSGSNHVHGSAYEFLQNNDFNARSFFNPTVGHVAYNYFGGTIGGPIKRNKAFFFGDYLKIFDHEGNTNNVTVPSSAFRTGDLSAAPTTIYDPATGNPDGTGRSPFPGNQIPAGRINPISQKIIGLVPGPNETFNPASPSNNYFALLPFHKDEDQFDTKIDYNITEKDRISGRFSFQRPAVFQAPLFGLAGGPGPGAGYQGTGTQKTYSSGINYNRLFSPTFLTEVRIGVAHYHNVAQTSDYGTNASTNLGIPGINIGAFQSGIVGVQINGGFSNPMIGYNPSEPWIRGEANIDVVNHWTKISGNHMFKWGADVRRVRDDLLQTQLYSPRGLYIFDVNQTTIPGAKTGFGNDFASFLLDLPNQAGRDLSSYFPTFRAWQVFGFAQDKWVVTPKLTLDLGVRWEFYPPGTPRFAGGFSNYIPGNNTLVVAGVGGNPNNLGMKTRYNYFVPRVGIAYRLNDKTVIRTGFGMSYTPFPDNKYAFDNYPIKSNNAFNPAGSGYGPAVFANGQPAMFQAGFPAPVPPAIPANGVIMNPDPNSTYETIPLDYKNPYVESWNFSVQRTLPKRLTLDVAYVGNHGVRTPAASNINAATVVGLGTKGQPEYPRTASTVLYWQGFSSMYNSLQAKLDRRFSNGMAITSAFTWGKGMNYQISDDLGLTYYINGRRNYARADYDRTLTFVQSYIYDLPFGKGRHFTLSGPMNLILGGWRVSGILSMMTGLPVNISYSAAGLSAPGNANSPNQIAPVQILHGINTGNPWFSTTSFAAPAALTFGSVGRNSFSGPGFFDLDATLFKSFHITERVEFQLRGEAYAITNTPQFNPPNGTLGNAGFGYITSTIFTGVGVNGVGGGRTLQLGAKVLF